ncbi:MAG: selenide, water dikinase SelD [Planctomycetes bacterium]|nr:selenide, water dikinase SelD [Planctomycetota bacterium]
MSQKDLAHVMRGMEGYFADERLIVGPENFADAGIVRFVEGRALVQTLDFFPPVVDDPWHYGAIAAANALSDVYAMGGTPVSALCIAGFPAGFDAELVRAILRGGFDKVREAGAAIAGGHTVRSAEIWFGFSVTGEVDPARLVPNDRAQPGDALYLTKPIGMGAVTTGIKKQLTQPAWIDAAHAQLARLNRNASLAMREIGVHAATDVTGFGLLGHAANIARASKVTLVLDAASIPLALGAAELAQQGCFSGGANRARDFLAEIGWIDPAVEEWRAKLCLDAETSGGLLVSIDPARGEAFRAALRARGEEAWCVGRVESSGERAVRLERGTGVART